MNELIEALEAVVSRNHIEDPYRSDDHLYYLCVECDGEGIDVPAAVEHEDDCSIGMASRAIKKAREP